MNKPYSGNYHIVLPGSQLEKTNNYTQGITGCYGDKCFTPEKAKALEEKKLLWLKLHPKDKKKG